MGNIGHFSLGFNLWAFGFMQATLMMTNKLNLFLAGGQEAVLAAMQRHPNVEKLQAPAMSCLRLVGCSAARFQGLGSMNQVSFDLEKNPAVLCPDCS